LSPGTADELRNVPARTLRATGPAVVLTGLAASAVALATAPALMPSGYSWVSQTTSESAAQGVQGAWLARIGFVVLGLSVILLTTFRQQRWVHGRLRCMPASAPC
jgi:hypothetical protein